MPAKKKVIKRKQAVRQPSAADIARERQSHALWCVIRKWLFVLFTVLFVGAGLALYNNDVFDRWYDNARTEVHSLTMELDLVVREVKVSGAEHVPQEHIAEALKLAGVRLDGSMPMYAFSIDEAQKELMSIGWVKSAEVVRVVPDTLQINIVERIPRAVWHYDGLRMLVDHKGKDISIRIPEEFKHLPAVEGKGAPAQLEELFAIMAGSEIAPRITKMRWVSGRRWDLEADSGIVLKMPEEKLATAWGKLEEMQQEKRVLDREIRSIDLRVGERIFIETADD